MVEYSMDGMNAYFDGVKYRKDVKSGYFLAATKDNGKRKRLHVAVWEYYHGSIPEGMHVHHIDKCKDHNDVGNLMLMRKSEHMTYHQVTASQEVNDWKRKNVVTNALPIAIKWHKSEDGKKWHKIHGRETWKNRSDIVYTCSNCGKRFESRKVYPDDMSRFCSNACKTQFRNHSGVDNEQRLCVKCGKPFVVNKYSKTTHCSRSCVRKKL